MAGVGEPGKVELHWLGMVRASVTGVGLVCVQAEQTRMMVGITYRERISGYP